MLQGVCETRFVVFGLIGSTRHHGKELLSSLLDYDLVSESTEEDSSLHRPNSRIQVRSFYGDRVVGYIEKSRCLMFLHFPFCQRESLDQQMELLILSALFSVCHIMIVLHKDTKFDINILHKIRTLQVIKNALVPVVQQNYPMETTKSFVSLRRELQKAWSSMCPGYCQPHLFFLFQTDHSFPSDEDLFNKLSKSIDQQISQIFQKFEIPSRRDPDPVINAFPVKVLLLPRMATTLNEHLNRWVSNLETPEQINNNSIPQQTFQRFRLFIHQRRDRMREMLESRTFDPFPTLESVHEVFCFVLELLEMYVNEWKSKKEEMHFEEGPVSEMADSIEVELSSLKSVLFQYFDSTTITEKVATKQNQTAFQLAMNMYKQLAPDPCIEDIHRKALARAKKVYDALSYGTERTTCDCEFTSLCEKMWSETRHQCEKKSLTGRPCIKTLAIKTPSTATIDACPHDSGFVISSSDGVGTNLKERKDPFTMEQANKEFYAQYSVDQSLEGQPSSSHRSSRGSLKHKTSDQSIAKQLSDFCIDLELKIQCSIDDPSLSFQKRHCTRVYGWCSLMTSLNGPASHKLNYEGFVGGKNQLYPLKLNLPSLGAMTSTLDESFPPLRGHGQKPPPPMLWPQIQHQIKNLRQNRKQLKKRWTLDPSQLKILMNPVLRGSNQDKPSRRDEGHGSSQARPNSSVDIWLGLEFEALDGTRFFASPRDLCLEPDVDLLSVLLSHDIPLFLPSPRPTQSEDEVGVRSKSLAQLQRIVVMTPPGPSVFALNPCMTIATKEEPFMKVEFSLETPVVLPPSSLSILRLPFVYGVPSEWKQGAETEEEWYPLIQSSVDHPYNAVVQKRSIVFPG